MLQFTYWVATSLVARVSLGAADRLGLVLWFITNAVPELKPSLRYKRLFPNDEIDIEEYKIKALSVNHPLDALGYEITSSDDGKKIFYTGDTGISLRNVWRQTTCDTLIIEITFPNRFKEAVKNAMHLSPVLLKNEMMDFEKINGYFPNIYIVHMSPKYEKEIKKELEVVSEELDIIINYAQEGKIIDV